MVPLLEELQRRRAFRALIGYGVVAFAVLQVVEPVMHGLRWPDEVLGYVVVGLAAGFPAVLVLAWVFDVKDGRLERTEGSSPPLGRWSLAMLGLLVVVGVSAGLALNSRRSRSPAADRPGGAAAASAVGGGPARAEEPSERPASLRVRVPVGGSPVRGPSDAPVTVVEFADLQCPYSKGAVARLARLQVRYPGKLRLVWKDYPMGLHPEAEGAAELAREAFARQGQDGFWRAHDALMAASPQLSVAALAGVATRLGLDAAAAMQAVASERHRAAIDADVDLADRVGSDGVPTFYVNGRRVVGDSDELDEAVEEELAEARRRLAGGVEGARLYEVLQASAAGSQEEPQRRVTMPDGRHQPARGGPLGKALEVHEVCAFSTRFCAWMQPQLRRVLAGYGDEVRLVFWESGDGPDPVSARLSRLALAVAPRPEVFWALHDALFALQPGPGTTPPPEAFSEPALRELARKAGADPAIVDYELAASGDQEGRLAAEARAVRGLQLRPGSLVVAGAVVSGFGPARSLRRAIDEALVRRR
jgi:protein-disulfide isomerase